MRALLRIIPSLLAAAILTLAVACGGGDDSTSGASDRDDASNLFVSDPAVALAASADHFERNVTSVQADFSFEMSAAGFEMGAEGDFGYRAPDSLYMKMSMKGGGGGLFGGGDIGDFEIIALGDELYMNSAFTGWIELSLAEMGADGESFRDLLSSHSPLDYRAILEAAGGEIESLGEDGGNQHVRMTVDLGDLMAAMLDSFSTDQNGTIEDPFGSAGISGPIVVDIWTDSETLLPQRVVAEAEFGVDSEFAAFRMEVKFHDYNGSIEIPEPPEDAKSLAEMFGDFDFEADSDGDGVPDFFTTEGN
jgi:hypothetical protein